MTHLRVFKSSIVHKFCVVQSLYHIVFQSWICHQSRILYQTSKSRMQHQNTQILHYSGSRSTPIPIHEQSPSFQQCQLFQGVPPDQYCPLVCRAYILIKIINNSLFQNQICKNKCNYNKIKNNVSTMDHNQHFGSRIIPKKSGGFILGLFLVKLAYLELKSQ